MASNVDLKEFVAGFVLEADEHLHSANRNLIAVSEAMKSGRTEPRAVRELFRSLHTIKGLASMVEAGPIVDIAHEMEGILRTADRSGGHLTERALDLLLKGTQAVEERVKAISKVGVTGITKAPARLIEDLILIQNSEASHAKKTSSVELILPDEVSRSLAAGDREQALQGLATNRNLILIDFEPSPERAASGLNITSIRERVTKLGDLIKVVPHSSSNAATGIAFFLLILTDQSIADAAKALGLGEASVTKVEVSGSDVEIAEVETLIADLPAFDMLPQSGESSSIRVDIRKLDEVLERLSELIVTRSKLSKAVQKLTAAGVDTRDLNAIVSENGRQLKRLRTAITQSRMVSLADLLQRLPLVVRGLTRSNEKSVNVFIQAGSAEVDKAVADKIFPAIIHLIRNSVDHALEFKSERKQAGKDEAGVITVRCDDSSGTSLIITISDDGRGIDRESVAKKSGKPVAQSNEELLSQICAPGLSTRDDVTLTSGRGMGMDIVKRTIEALGGSLALETTPGIGTTFKVKVPVSITIIDVLSFVSGGQVFVVPVSMIDEIVEVDPGKLPKSPSLVNGGPQPRLMNRRGETIPFLVLESVLKNQPDKSIPSKALVVNQRSGAVAFGVDRMIGQQEVVIRPIDDRIIKVAGMNGAADLGDGHPTLVLDLASLGSNLTGALEVSL